MTKVLECSLEVSWFELQLHNYIHFQINTIRKGMSLLFPSGMDEIVSLLFFYKDGFGIK